MSSLSTSTGRRLSSDIEAKPVPKSSRATSTPRRLEAREDPRGLLGLGEHGVLGDLDAQAVAGDVVDPQAARSTKSTISSVANCAGDMLIAHRRCRASGYVRRHSPSWRHASAKTQRPMSTTRPVSSATVMNSRGRQEAPRRVLPAHERLDGEQSCRVRRSISGWKCSRSPSVSMASRRPSSIRDRSSTAWRSTSSNTTAWLRPCGLRGVQRDVGLAEQVHPVLRAELGDDDPDARGVAHGLAADLDGRADHVEQPVRAREHLHLARRVVDEDHELVAAEPRGEVVRRGCSCGSGQRWS